MPSLPVVYFLPSKSSSPSTFTSAPLLTASAVLSTGGPAAVLFRKQACDRRHV